MMRLRAVRSLLLEDVAGLRPQASEEEDGDRRRDLAAARRRAATVAALCAGALLVLFALRERGTVWLDPSRGEEGVFTLGVLLVAAYCGFRLAQYLHLRTVTRLWEELGERSED